MKNVAGVVKRLAKVVRNHYDWNSVVLVKVSYKLVHFLGGGRIKAGNRLVKQNHFLRSAEGAGKKDSLLLAARKVSVASFCKREDSKPLHVFKGRLLFFSIIKWPKAGDALAAWKDYFQNAGRKVALHLRLLGKVSDLIFFQAVAKNYLSVHRALQAQDCPHERGFSASVFADNAKVVAGVHFEWQIADEDIFIVA